MLAIKTPTHQTLEQTHMQKYLFSTVAMMSIFLTGCAVQPVIKPQFTGQAPTSILIIPAVNKTVNTDAADYFLSTISRPIAEKGFYVFPVNTIKQVMELEGMGDADMVHQQDTKRLAELFGADAVLYVSINRWDARYLLLNTTVTVDFDYLIKDGKTGGTLWKDQQHVVYSPQNQNSTGNLAADLIVMAVQAAATKIAPNYIPLTQLANAQAANKIPNGKYLPEKSQ
jgi:hypothetical protein